MLKRDKSSFEDGGGRQKGLKWNSKAKQKTCALKYLNRDITTYLMLNQWRHENSEREIQQ